MPLSTEEWPGWVELGGWLDTEMFNRPIRWLSILVLTELDVERATMLIEDNVLPLSETVKN